MGKVTDPALLAQLEGGKVTDPALLQQLESAPQEPGLLDKAKAVGGAALKWATTPFSGMQGVVNEQQQRADAAGPPLINRMLGVPEQSEPSVLTGAKKFVSGLPGYQPSSQTSAGAARGEQFGKEHPVLKYALPLAAGFANPVIPAKAAGGGVSAAEQFANRLAARTLRGTATEYKALGKQGTQDMGDFLLRQNAVRFGSSPAAVAERVSALPKSTGEALSGTVEALDATGQQVSKHALAQHFSKLAEEASVGGPGAAPLVAKYQSAANAVLHDIEQSGQPMMSFKQAEKWKQAYQAPINYAKQSNTPLEMGSKELASAARQGVEDAAAQAGQGNALGEQFLNAKRESGLAQQAAKMAKGAEGRRLARNMVSPTGRATQIAGSVGALASGHPLGMIPAMIAGPALQGVLERSPAAAAVLLKSLGPGLGRSAAQGAATDAITLMRQALRKSSQIQEMADNP